MAPQTQEQPPQTVTTDDFFDGAIGSADVILRSSDHVEFHTHRVLLSLASPVFRDMFTLPQDSITPASGTTQPHTAIPMAEHSHIIRHFLTWCDPRAELTCDEWADIVGVLELADKFDIVPLRNAIKRTIVSSHWAHTNPLSVYGTAIRFQFDDLACLAAKSSLQLSLGESPSAPEMDHISGINFHDLVRYHYSCSMQVIGATKNLTWMTPSAKEPFKQHSNNIYSGHDDCCSSSNNARYPGAGSLGIVTWLYNHLTLAGQLLLNQPAGKTVEQLSLRLPENWEPFRQANACATCRPTWRYNILRFNTELSAEIERRIGTVSVRLWSPKPN
ncbi:hypothetical protein BD779DRAFT_1437260 [Infundibulicybe gibba]|nr:hypothetical protein BD779DRAFT_1437260 [Infundibulicybe gibba]